MSELFYKVVRFIGKSAFWVSSTPVVIGTRHTRRQGAFIIAANHESPYDVPLLIRHAERHLDFMSIVEVFQKPWVRRFYEGMNTFALDRSRPDMPTVRNALGRLQRGRVVAMFPEGGFRRGEQSAIHSRKIRPGVGRLAKLANAPIVPAVVIGSDAYWKFRGWLPLKETRYGIIFGAPLWPKEDSTTTEEELIDRWIQLHNELSAEMKLRHAGP